MPTTVSTTVTGVASPFISGQPTVATAVAKSRSLPRSIVDYSDLEASSASPPLPIEPVAAAESSGTQFSAPPQVCMILMRKIELKIVLLIFRSSFLALEDGLCS